MSPYKRRVSARAIERNFPHVVETVVPKGGLDKTLNAMHEFHRRHRIEAHTGKGRREHSAVVVLLSAKASGIFASVNNDTTMIALEIPMRSPTRPLRGGERAAEPMVTV